MELPHNESNEADGDLDLPPILSTASSSIALRLQKPNLSHKRTFDPNNVFNDSSDPAVFSSDDHQLGSLDDYASKRRKKHHWKGTWWGERTKRLSVGSSTHGHTHEAPADKAQRKFQRNYDSGIFMGSEGTDSSFDEEFLEESKRRNEAEAAGDEGFHGPHFSIEHDDVVEQTHELRDEPSMEGVSSRLGPYSESAKAIIQLCLEEGKETIDLSSLWLTSEALPGWLLSSLRSFTKIPTIEAPPTSQEAYESLEPHLRLFLSNNTLTTVPAELFNLADLRVLSLRHNRLTEIAAAISRLTNLTELNVGGNQLEVLPWEILQMMKASSGKLWKFTPFPNPFRRFKEWELITRTIGNRRRKVLDRKSMRILSSSRVTPIIKQVAKSHVTCFAINGMPCRMPPERLGRHNFAQTSFESRERMGLSAGFSHVPSLLELSLRATTQSPYFADLVEESQSEIAVQWDPERATEKFLNMAVKVVDAGGQICPTCEKPFIIPRAEWVEWWDLLPLTVDPGQREGRDGNLGMDTVEDENGWTGLENDEGASNEEEDDQANGQDVHGPKKKVWANVVPFRKRVCSWACVDI